MPFVHNYSSISELMAETVIGHDNQGFIRNVIKISKGYEKGVKSIKKLDMPLQIMDLLYVSQMLQSLQHRDFLIKKLLNSSLLLRVL